jgi:hypothetical protein
MTESLLTKIAEQGLVGIFLVLALIAIYYLYREACRERQSRLEDMKQVWNDDVKFREELKALNKNIFDTLQKIFDLIANKK